MKYAVNISRIVACVAVSLYTLLACFHLGEEAHYKCMRFVPVDEALALESDRITPEAWPYIISAVGLLVLCTVAMIFLFRKGRLAAIIAELAIVTSAIYGMSLNTMLSEYGLWRVIMRVFKLYGLDVVYVSVKNVLGLLSILSAICYFVMYMISCKKISNLGEDLNEQNS